LRLDEDLRKIRKILLDEGAKTWGELRKKTEWSSSVLKNRMDLLISTGEITPAVGERKGRRITVYKLTKEEKSRAEISRYESTQFIERLQNPIYDEKIGKIEDSTASLAYFVEINLSPEFDALGENELNGFRRTVKKRLGKIMDEQFQKVMKDLAVAAKDISKKTGGSCKMAFIQSIDSE
jgi:DNA-binding MarR family transcriptional regulator